ncbi:hypothetical protein F2P56_024561 [Juglans regia]|uniref:Retrotransposon gag domain-containing protein n=1 Tax=Juglans regia TaxID=51240 RepID=A0A833UCN7_JUGRE|nr:hypothetical protein F2P56_024561 [Juglans regia]
MSEIKVSNTMAQSEDTISHQSSGDLQNIQAAYRLNGKNYLKWSQFIRTYLKGKGKLSHLLGTGPKEGNPRYDAWDEADSMIMSWLWNSMNPEISNTCMFLSTAKEIWDAVQQTYSKARDAAQVYEIKVKTSATRQGNKTVTEYANLLKNLWQELDHYRCIETKCASDAAILKGFIEKDRVYDFLAGLNVEFDQVRVQILGKEEVPSLNETISLIRAEESRRGVMLEPQVLEGSAMVTKTEQQPIQENMKRDPLRNSGRDNKDALWCTYCKKPRHTKQNCWKLNGKPPSKEWGYQGGSQRNPNQAYFTMTQPTNQQHQENSQNLVELNKEEIEKFRGFLGSLEKPTGACSLALSGPGFGEEDWTC